LAGNAEYCSLSPLLADELVVIPYSFYECSVRVGFSSFAV
jgi:hypothetical protein